MAVTKVLARHWGKYIKSGGNYLNIAGIRSFGIDPNKQDVDVSDFDSNGWTEHMVAARGLTVTLEGFFMEDVATKARDAGQQAVETLAREVGPASLGSFRLTTPGGTTWTFSATAEVAGPSGDVNAVADWKATLNVSGQVVIA
jgi:hypothetical protein